jgi:hypothetical protein
VVTTTQVHHHFSVAVKRVAVSRLANQPLAHFIDLNVHFGLVSHLFGVSRGAFEFFIACQCVIVLVGAVLVSYCKINKCCTAAFFLNVRNDLPHGGMVLLTY